MSLNPTDSADRIRSVLKISTRRLAGLLGVTSKTMKRWEKTGFSGDPKSRRLLFVEAALEEYLFANPVAGGPEALSFLVNERLGGDEDGEDFSVLNLALCSEDLEKFRRACGKLAREKAGESGQKGESGACLAKPKEMEILLLPRENMLKREHVDASLFKNKDTMSAEEIRDMVNAALEVSLLGPGRRNCGKLDLEKKGEILLAAKKEGDSFVLKGVLFPRPNRLEGDMQKLKSGLKELYLHAGGLSGEMTRSFIRDLFDQICDKDYLGD